MKSTRAIKKRPGRLSGESVILSLKRKLGAKTDRALKAKVGLTAHAIHNWKNRKAVTGRQVAGLVHKTAQATAQRVRSEAIRPLVEFFRIEKRESKRKAKYQIFGLSTSDEKHPYLAGLRTELESHFGIYLFFDSRGRAIYAGKARRQSLWREMNSAFNRERGDLQRIKRVNHPARKQAYKTSEEKSRQIREYSVPLHDLAAYVSAYQVDDELIGRLEALLVRSFANDLLNKRMERFGVRA